MKRKVLEAFDYAHDGVRANRLKAGRPYEIRDEHIARFEAEGKIEPVGSFKGSVDDAFQRYPVILKTLAESEAGTPSDTPARAKPKGKAKK